VSKIKIAGLKPWQDYLMSLLRDLSLDDPSQLDLVLDVGIGNGHAEEPFLSRLHSFKAVDISDQALQYAKRSFRR
jgi:methylase of polypeptide subunit release factors